MTQPESNEADDFTKLIREIKKAYEGFSNLDKNQLLDMTRQLLSNLRINLEGIIQAIHQESEGSEESNNPSSTSSISSLQSITLESSLDELQKTSEPDCDIEDSTAGSAAAIPSVSQAQPNVQEALGVLERMAAQLKGFYQWLKEKAKKMASDVWKTVRQAFCNMLAWLRRISNRVGASCASVSAGTAKVHLA